MIRITTGLSIGSRAGRGNACGSCTRAPWSLCLVVCSSTMGCGG